MLLGLIFAATAAAQAPAGTDELVGDLLRDWKVPGLALSIVQNGAVVHQKAYGLRDVEKKLPVTAKTSFAYGSITKSLTVLLLHSLAAEGKIEWDDPVRDQLPGFKLSDPVASERATPRDLVTHRTGMPRHDGLWTGGQPPAEAQFLKRLPHLAASADFRTTYQYNNLMYITAGMLGSHAGGDPWAKLVRQRVLEPLHLGPIGVTLGEVAKHAEVAVPYGLVKDEFRPVPFRSGNTLISAAGGSGGTIGSLTQYLLAHMNHGKVNGKQALPAAFFDKMKVPQTPMPATGEDSPFSQGGSYGMGLFIGRYQGRTMVYHTGTISGYHAMMWWLPEENLGITVLLNRVERAVPHILVLTLADQMLKQKTTDWNAVYKKGVRPPAPERKPVVGTTPSHPLPQYAGLFANPGYGTVTINESKDSLNFVRGMSRSTLKHFHYDTFLAGSERVTFHTDADGAISALEIRLEPAVAPIVFEKQNP